MPEGRFDKTCKRCGYSWKAIKQNPKSCPDCKTRSWNKEPVIIVTVQ